MGPTCQGRHPVQAGESRVGDGEQAAAAPTDRALASRPSSPGRNLVQVLSLAFTRPSPPSASLYVRATMAARA